MARKGPAIVRRRDGKARSWIIWLMLLAMAPIVTGCYGRFPLTRNVYDFNGEVSDVKIVQTIVMWVLVIVPVYGIAMLADLIVFNLIEFWSGEPVNLGKVTGEDGTQYVLEPSEDGKAAVLTVSRGDRVLTTVSFVKVSDTKFEVRDAEGRLAGMVVRTPEGGFNLTDARGRTIRTISADQIASLSG